MIGRTISHYQVLEKVGEGGMGVVYKARDTRLNRLVALKALPADTAVNPERRARFLQEAQAASALNHPGIVTIHDVLKDDEGDVIVMELIPGRSLDELIPRKGMPLGEALKLAIQMAGALEAAHDAGIVHRDFKPGNVMVGDDGRVRILDFGLAKVSPIAGEEKDGSDTRATEAAPRTRDGQVLGTVSYMSPEQAEGRAVDARSDIFSFGAVLYEMVTGHRPFIGSSSLSTLAAVIKEDPPPLPADVPHDLGKLIEKCLRKDPGRRMRHMDDVRVALEDLKQESDSGTLMRQAPVAVSTRRGRPWGPVGLAAVALVATAAGIAWWATGRSAKSVPPMREIPFTADPGFESHGRFSPDGSTVVYARFPRMGDGGADLQGGSLQVRMLDADGSQLLREGGYSPAYSPDGRWIAFDGRPFGQTEGPLFVIPHIGGRERKVAVTKRLSSADGPTWTADGEWLISDDRDGDDGPFHLALFSVETGERRRLTTPPAGILGDVGPALSPDGRTLAFVRQLAPRASHLLLLSLGPDHQPTGEPRRVAPEVPHPNHPVFMPGGEEILFCSGQFHAATLWRVRTDGTSPATPLGLGGRGALWPDVDPTGTKLLYTKRIWDPNIWRVALDTSGRAAGKPEPLIESSQPDTYFDLSPDGQTIAYASERSGAGEVWLADADGSQHRPLTSMDATAIWNTHPRWSPDGEWIAFDADFEGNRDVFVIPADGGTAKRLTTDPSWDAVLRWSADGRWIYFDSARKGRNGAWRVPRDGGEADVEEAPRGMPDPEGRFRYFDEEADGIGMIRREPVNGGAVETVVEDALWSFIVTRQGLYFTRGTDVLHQDRIVFFDLATQKEEKLVDLRPASYSGWQLSLSPDGRWLYYIQCDRETDDLMLVENFR
jgi:Tol biopolymer transport system component/tRNA A-37 threonylcarbamoyl transferase component Bud32